MGGARYPKHPFLWFHVMLVMLVMHVILPQCGSSMIKRYQAWEAWVCQQQEGNDQMGKLKKWKNGNDKNDHFIVSLSGATNLPAGKVGQADWVGSIGHLNDISDYFEKNMKQTIYTTTFLSIFLVVSTLSIPFLPIMVSPLEKLWMYDLVGSRPAKLFGLNPTRDACRDAPLVGRLAAFVDVSSWLMLAAYEIHCDFLGQQWLNCGELFGVRNWGIPE